jgi:hypothetical protein
MPGTHIFFIIWRHGEAARYNLRQSFPILLSSCLQSHFGNVVSDKVIAGATISEYNMNYRVPYFSIIQIITGYHSYLSIIPIQPLLFHTWRLYQSNLMNGRRFEQVNRTSKSSFFIHNAFQIPLTGTEHLQPDKFLSALSGRCLANSWTFNIA